MTYPIAPPDGSRTANPQSQPANERTAPRSQEGTVNESSTGAETVDPKSVSSSIEKTNAETLLGGRTIEFSFDDTINRVVVKVRAADSGEIVRQIPPEEYVRFLARFKELLGVLFDETA